MPERAPHEATIPAGGEPRAGFGQPPEPGTDHVSFQEGRMPQPREPRQRLTAELRRLRELAGLSGRQLAARLGTSQSKISRIESTALLPPLPLVAAWAEAVDASPETRQMLCELTDEAFTQAHTYGIGDKTLADPGEAVRQHESNAEAVLNLELTVIPTLLQTAEYARQRLAIGPFPGPPEQLAAQVAQHVDRQMILYGQQRLEFLIAEAALRIRYSPVPAHLTQLDRIDSLSTLANVSIGLIPHHHQVRTIALHGFTLYQGPEQEDTLVSVEAMHGQLHITDPDSIDRYRRGWELLHASALFGDQARTLLRQIMAEISEQTS